MPKVKRELVEPFNVNMVDAYSNLLMAHLADVPVGNLEESKATVAKLTKQEIDDALNEDSSEDDDLNFLKNRPCKN